jgi:proteasome alpha subunit
MQHTDQQAYDRGTTIFSPDGRLYQVEYAREAVKQGSPVVGVCGEDSAVLVSHVPRHSPLVNPGSVEKLFAVDDHVAIGSAGHAADTRRLVDLARRRAQDERIRYGEATTVGALTTSVADHLQEYTQTGGARPYGVALLVAGYDDGPQLLEIDPSGATREWRADAVGHGASDAIERFEDEYATALAAGDALSLALDGLDAAVEELAAENVEAATVTEDGYETVSSERLAGLLDAESA